MKKNLFLYSILFVFIASCKNEPKYADLSSFKKLNYKNVKYAITPPEWTKTASIYEVNVRQYTPEGTFKAFQQHLPRLKKMGVDILWLMPIHPIGLKNRKGTVGSYYSVRDYLAVDSSYGTIPDFTGLVEEVHNQGMYLIIDWVANHTSWDNVLVSSNPEWYTRDSLGNFKPPVDDWSDVMDLNYDDKGLWKYMINAMKYWVRETNIDGFRCDVAGMVPLEFWNEARSELDKIKPVFMLAEAEGPELHEKAFDMTYGWEFHFIMNEVAQGKKTIIDIDNYFEKNASDYSMEAYIMQFTSNHDENTWKGTEFERMGDGAPAFFVMSATVPGMPLVYTGQEAALDKRLEFFEKDVVEWKDYPLEEFYSTILQLKENNEALWNGSAGGNFVRITNSKPNTVYSFAREKGNNRVLVILNLSREEQQVTLDNDAETGKYFSIFDKKEVAYTSDNIFDLQPWGYKVLVK